MTVPPVEQFIDPVLRFLPTWPEGVQAKEVGAAAADAPNLTKEQCAEILPNGKRQVQPTSSERRHREARGGPRGGAWGSLANLARTGDAQALRTTLETDPALGVALGVAASGVRDLLENEDDQLVPAIDELLRRQRCGDAVARQLRAHRLSLEAAVEVADTARWLDGRAFLDRRLVLGPLLSHPTHVIFDVDGADLAVGVPLLRRAARATKPFVDVIVSVDRSGLYLRWRGGRGGLTFRPQPLDQQEARRAVRVVLVRPQMPRPRSVLHGGAWIRDVIEEVGTFF